MADDDAPPSGDGKAKDTPAEKKQVKNEHVLIIVGVVTLLVTFIYLRRASSKNSSSQSVAASPYGVNQNQDPYGYGGSINTLANDMQSIQSEIAGLQADSGNHTSSSFGGAGTLTGLGYAPPTGSTSETSSSGGLFNELSSWNAALALPADTPVYYQPAPGVFETAGTVGGGTSKLTLPGGTNTPLFLGPTSGGM